MSESPFLPPPPAPVHFVGIGGISMSGLARVLHDLGYVVSGSDVAASDQTAALAERGISIAIDRDGDPERAANAAIVVTTRAALRPESSEVRAAIAAGVRFVKRGDLLGTLANERRTVAVAGSHGKSTTCGMLATALIRLDADPSYAIGAVLRLTGKTTALGRGETMVVEADEFDYAFHALSPEVAVVTNVEYDHPDIFPDGTAYDAAFARFTANVRPGGTLIVAADDPGCRRIQELPEFGADAQLITFGRTEDAAWCLTGCAGGWRVRTPIGETVPLRLCVPGEHNARNATAALAALSALGYEPERAAAALGAYDGIGRRFETKGTVAGVTVVDDYAHHPSEIRATLRAARERFPGRRLWAAFQPHTYSRTRALLDEFGSAFGDADRTMILAVYAAREADTFGVGAADLVALLPSGTLSARDPADAAAELARLVEPDDVVLTLGAGDVTRSGPLLLHLLDRQTSADGGLA